MSKSKHNKTGSEKRIENKNKWRDYVFDQTHRESVRETGQVQRDASMRMKDLFQDYEDKGGR